ncbi:Fc receptor-like protein 5 isoform X2 [Lampris incognitus]|uniref:Fc receptor-like protein 5 isoform X2 n=1 Tax=Lampris incognitus TaxID=2546036 RepID=UPI0024B53ABE|nr:Fc receptor-like protein 5 isoform X2 [Lampris incognitus]
MTAKQILHFLVLTSLVFKISGSHSLQPVLTGPHMAILGSKVAFQCKAPDSSKQVTYELLRDRNIHIDTKTDQRGGQTASFMLKVSLEGSYHCKVTTEGNTGVSNSIRLQVVIPVSGTSVTSDPYPPVLYEGSRLVLSCVVTKGSHLSYTWFFNRREVTPSTQNWLRLPGNKLIVEEVSSENAGIYSCLAGTKIMENSMVSSSRELQVVVKGYFSTPKISFTISKDGNNYSGNVTCWSSRGSPPVTFDLILDDKETGSIEATESLAAWFNVPLVPGRDMGVAQCRIRSEVQQLMSEPLTLEVVPVGGHIKVEVEYLYTADSKMAAARLNCCLSRGTFPSFSWLFNSSHLPTETHTPSQKQSLFSHHHTFTDQMHTLILTKQGPEDSGYYQCRARDSYDDSSPWVESAAVLVQMTEATLANIEVITIGFCCFLLLALVGGMVCVMRRSPHQQANVGIGETTSSGAYPLSVTTSFSEGELGDRQILHG